ncbi:beta-galactosidase [soil metagenome]
MNFQLGAAYYPDYIVSGQPCRTASGEVRCLSWRERVNEDMIRMKKAGLTAIRIGEFSWASVEPQRGAFEPDRFNHALNLAEQFQLEVIFCTPTATPPKWLIDEHPDILPHTRDGSQVAFGSRRHYDVCHPVFRDEAERITRLFAHEFGQHPAVVGWQVDNEFGCHSSLYAFGPHTRESFQRWLEKKYEGDIAQLNLDWFTCFWSQNYSSFDQIELPLSSWADQNPHLELDFRRFSNLMYQSFQQMQCEIIRSNSPGRLITHNFMSMFTDLDPWLLSQDLDFVGFDHYQMSSEANPRRSSWQFSLMRSLKNKPFIVLEQQPLQVNWQAVNRRFSYDWLFLWGVQSAVTGASGMYYFSWQRMYGGAEQYHDGIVPHDVRVSESWQEKVIRSKLEFLSLMQNELAIDAVPEPSKDVLCLHNFESLWTHEISSQSTHYSTHVILDMVSEFCTSCGFGLSFANSIADCGKQLFEYKLLIMPGFAFELSESEKVLLKAFLDAGGRVLSMPRTAMKRRNNQMSAKPLDLFGDDFYFEDFGALVSDEMELVETDSGTLQGILWAEKIKIVSTNWKQVAKFDGGLYADSPAALLNKTFSGGGSYLHLAFCPQPSAKFFSWLLDQLELSSLTSEPCASELQITRFSIGDRPFIALINFAAAATTAFFNNSFKKAIAGKLNFDQTLDWSKLSCGESLSLEVEARQVVVAELAQ